MLTTENYMTQIFFGGEGLLRGGWVEMPISVRQNLRQINAYTNNKDYVMQT